MIFDNLYWREPLWLFAFLLPWLIILNRSYYQKKRWYKIADPHLLAWCYAHSRSSGENFQRLLFALAWLFFCVALAGPRTAQWIPPSLQQKNISVTLIFDYSSSMKAIDHNTSRIVQAQNIVKYWLKDLPPNVRVGLRIFSGHSHNLLIPTSDKTLVNYFVEQLHKFRPPTLGNNLADALQAAKKQFNSLTGEHYIIVLSDGDLGKKSTNAVQNIATQIKTEAHLHLSIIGVGKDEAVRIPLSKTKMLTHQGKVIVTRRHIPPLKKLAQVSGGRYYSAEQIQELKLEQILALPKARIDTKFTQHILWHEWFFIPLLAAVFFTLLALQISGANSRRLAGATLMLLLSSCYQSDKAGEDGYSQFVQGVACYRLKNYSCAQQFFTAVAWSASEPSLQAKAVFNLGNTYYKLGDYEQALVLFKDAEQRGISITKTRINQAFSASFAAAVQQHLADIAKTKQKAEWLAAAGKMPEGFSDRLAEGITLKRGVLRQDNHQNHFFPGMSSKERNLLLDYGIKRIQNKQKVQQVSNNNSWVFSAQDKEPQDTAALLNDLMSYETGFHYVPDEALQIEGQRSW